jgi:hypothetical protein
VPARHNIVAQHGRSEQGTPGVDRGPRWRWHLEFVCRIPNAIADGNENRFTEGGFGPSSNNELGFSG